jgi:uncharacterized protein YjiS (DUF1127 family)
MIAMLAIRWPDVNAEPILGVIKGGFGMAKPVQRSLPSTVLHVACWIFRLRSERRARRALAAMRLRHDRHLLDDVGLEEAETGGGAQSTFSGERHRFWML